MARIVLTDASPLIAVARVGGLAVAAEFGIRVAGTAAIVGMAKTHGLIPSARDVFSRMHASDFRISAQVINTILQRVGE